MPALTSLTQILFLSPDNSYFADLHTSKKPKIENVVKIDFPLIEDGKVNIENLATALKELQPKNLHIIVSDELFFHHIADFPAKSDQSLEQGIADKVAEVFPDQTESLHIVTLELAKTTRIQTIQITAMTKGNLASIAQAAKQADVKVRSLIPASFVVKAFVSVDPSLFILQTASALLITSHYIGVEFAERIGTDKLKQLQSIVKKLHTDHSYIQHAYLAATDDKASIKKALEEVLPTQDIKLPSVDTDDDTPNFLQILMIGFKDVVENKFPFPEFHLPEVVEVEEKVESEPAKAPAATVLADVFEEDETEEESDLIEDVEDEIVEQEIDIKEEHLTVTQEVVRTEPDEEDANVTPVEPVAEKKVVEVQTVSAKQKTTTKTGRGIFSYILLTLGVALLISLIGGGIIISQQALQDRNQNQDQELVSPEPEVSPSPTPSPTPAVTPIPQEELQVLVVNATTIAGHAGRTSSALEAAGYENVSAANARGEYEEGTYIMIKDDQQEQLAELIADETDLEFDTIEFDDVEDPNDRYDVVIVLAE